VKASTPNPAPLRKTRRSMASMGPSVMCPVAEVAPVRWMSLGASER
jgi:hypothetical protein